MSYSGEEVVRNRSWKKGTLRRVCIRKKCENQAFEFVVIHLPYAHVGMTSMTAGNIIIECDKAMNTTICRAKHVTLYDIRIKKQSK